jgi:hypothetical protein
MRQMTSTGEEGKDIATPQRRRKILRRFVALISVIVVGFSASWLLTRPTNFEVLIDAVEIAHANPLADPELTQPVKLNAT